MVVCSIYVTYCIPLSKEQWEALEELEREDDTGRRLIRENGYSFYLPGIGREDIEIQRDDGNYRRSKLSIIKMPHDMETEEEWGYIGVIISSIPGDGSSAVSAFQEIIHWKIKTSRNDLRTFCSAMNITFLRKKCIVRGINNDCNCCS